MVVDLVECLAFGVYVHPRSCGETRLFVSDHLHLLGLEIRLL